VGGSSKLHSAKSQEDNSLCNTCSQKRKYEYKNLAYTSLIRPILEYGAKCWDPCREGQIDALDRVQKKTAQFTNHTKDSDWETLAQRKKIARLCKLLRRTVGNGIGKLYVTGCEGLTI
jgi:hypothetical protein